VKLIVGLGNPGREYSHSRHNVGFLCINRLAHEFGLDFDRTQKRSRIALGKIDNEDVVLAKPHTYMNLSGEAVAALLKQFSLPPDDLIVIHDDMDLPFGKMRIRPGGSSAGHKGIASIINNLGTPDFTRIRIGIGHPEDEVVDYVLGNFTADERHTLDEVIEKVIGAVLRIMSEDVTAAMNKCN
jgi:peptidyl-tRNA hydrolase, PTH1 family